MIRLFLGLTLLLSLAFNVSGEFWQIAPYVRRLPSGLENLIIAAGLVGLFLLGARISARLPQGREGLGLLGAGIVCYVVVQIVAGAALDALFPQLSGSRSGFFPLAIVAMWYVVPMKLVVQIILLAGALRVFLNLRSTKEVQ